MPEPTEVQNVTTPTPAETTPATAPAPNAATFTQDQVEQMIKERLARKEEADRKKADAERAKAEQEAAAKNGEWEKLAKQREDELNKAKEQLAAKDLEVKKQAIASKVGLPAAFADRLKGNTDEELEADAKTILAALPKQDKPVAGINPTNPGEATNTATETWAQKKARLSGSPGNIFSSGGGVIWPPNQEV